MSTCYLDCLPDEILLCILELAMTRDFLLFIEHLFPAKKNSPKFQSPSGNSCTHRGSLGLSDHKRDWVAINGTNRRIRRVGKPSFFHAKAFATATRDLPATKATTITTTKTKPATPAITALPRPCYDMVDGVSSMMDQDQAQTQELDGDGESKALVLAQIRNVVIVDPNEFRPNWYLRLPAVLAPLFPQLRRCTLLYYYPAAVGHVSEVQSQRIQDQKDAAAAAALRLARPAATEMQTLFKGIGMPPNIDMEEAMITDIRLGKTLEVHRGYMETSIYPILRISARGLSRMAQDTEANHISRKSLVQDCGDIRRS